ncbi:MAG TPA: hypothetical protein VJ891_01135 [Casimicrobiaceae bacterium]|nr:hypothetical protein [Casimicrobiaceae bacterium]
MGAIVAPIVGAVGGALAINAGASRFGVDRQHAAIAATVGGLLTAAATGGWVRDLAVGVAAAGAITLAMQRFGAQPAAKPAEPTKDDPRTLITRDELQRTLAQFAADRQRADQEFAVQLRASMRTIIADAIADVRNAHATRDAAAPAAAETVPQENEAQPASPQQAAVDTDAEGDTASTAVDAHAKVHAILVQLDGAERAQLGALVAAMPDDAFMRAQQYLLQLSPDGAAQYIRENLLRREVA